MKIETNYTVSFDGGWDGHRLGAELSSAQRVVLVAHQNADGDAVGSVTGMYALLRRVLPQAQVVPMLPDGCPDELAWLPNTGAILSGQADHEACLAAIAAADTVIALDLNSLERTGCLADAMGRAKAKRLMIDHHMDPDHEGYAMVISEPSISSTCELIYWAMRSAFGPDIFDLQSATSLYTGICTDTGTFSYSNDHASVYLAAADLLRFGIDPHAINRQIKNVFTEQRLRFFGHALADLTTVYPERQVALMVISAAEMERYGVASAELTGLINEVMRLRDIDCGILIREEKMPTVGASQKAEDEQHKVRLSLRSKEHYDVNLLAAELFGGGGHKRAAGATSYQSLKATVDTVMRRLALALMPLLLLVSVSCKQVPVVEVDQRPTDTLRENLINANRYIAGSENRQIESYLERRGWEATQLLGGTRVHTTSQGTGKAVEPDETLHITYSVDAIDGTHIYRPSTDTVVAGRLKPTRGLDAALLSMHHQGSAIVITPSEQAYGVVGDGDRVGPRMILVYNVKINN